MFNRILFSLIFCFGSLLPANNQIVDSYVQEGLNNNLALKQKEFEFQKSVKELKEARGMFLPSIGIEARYSRAGGGREIGFPVGDIMNPVYQATGIPMRLDNLSIPFLREEEHDTKIRLVQPIFQPAIYFNYKIKSNLKDLKKAETSAYKRTLIAEIKGAYFNYLKAYKVVHLFEKTTTLLEENLRVSEKLFNAQKVTKDAVYRAQAELGDLQQKKIGAQNQSGMAQSYFNFLLNRSLDTPIEIDTSLSIQHQSGYVLETLKANALKQREEIEQISKAIEAADGNADVAATRYFPRVTGVVDYGYQGEDYQFNEENDYWMASVALQWNLFNGFQDEAKREQALIQKKRIETQYKELKKQIELQVKQAYDNFILAFEIIEVASQRLQSSRESFKIVNKKYEQGMVAQIEYLDARTQLTNAEINEILTKYDFFIKHAELERVAALYSLKDE